MARPATRRSVLYGALPLTLVALTERLDTMHDRRPSKYFHDPRVAELALAAASGQVGRVRELVAAGVDPNARGDQGVTPLLWATRIGNAAGMAALMRAGADPTLADDDGRTPLKIAVDEYEGTDQLAALIANGAPANSVIPNRDETLLMRATSMGHPEQVRFLIRAGADVNWQDLAGNTALINGATPDNWPCALLLLDAGADPLHRNRGGTSFVDSLADDRPDTLLPSAREDRARVLAWLRAHNVPLVTRRGEVIER